MHFDGYEGWVDSKQYQVIDESNFNKLSGRPIIKSGFNRIHIGL
jgi:hypothetical protein